VTIATPIAIPFPASRERPLVAELPEIGRNVPFRALVHAPSAVEPCAAIEPWLGRGGVFQKRDDQVSPLYGGNKVRRFEYLLADAEAHGAKHLVTVGGLASTQVMATILFGRGAGFDVTAALFDQPITRFAREALLTGAAAGGTLVYGGGYVTTAIRTIQARCGAEKAYLILPGASTPRALLGYVDAMLELGEQVRRGEAPQPDVIVVPAGSGGTLAALAVGAAILKWDVLITGVRITDLIACNRVTIGLLIRALRGFLGRRAAAAKGIRMGKVRVAIHHGAIGRGYGYATPAAIEAVPEVERLLGVPGEITYSGKGLVGLRAVAAEHPKKTILYWHTLSSAPRPSLSASPDALPSGFARAFVGDVAI
jgi:1-aminocyclopropane-1-carboxylate deaminase/D-cysteine desulfhydrase-like pyridoxal-dependent ACC family enzyme